MRTDRLVLAIVLACGWPAGPATGAAPASRPSAVPATPAPDRDGFITVAPVEDEQAVLHNPDMGWVLYENYPLDPRPGGSSTLVTLPGEDFPKVDAVALMFSWQV